MKIKELEQKVAKKNTRKIIFKRTEDAINLLRKRSLSGKAKDIQSTKKIVKLQEFFIDILNGIDVEVPEEILKILKDREEI